MGALTLGIRNSLLNHIFGGSDYTRPATLYFGLSTTVVSDTGTNISEPSGNAYARVTVTNNATNFPAASNGTKSNGAIISFPEATGSWGTVRDFFISTASSGGTIIGYGSLPEAQAIVAGNLPRFPIGSLEINLTNQT